MRRVLPVLGGTVVAAAALLAVAGPAAAHVTVTAPDATQGGDTVVTFQVPTESDTASTTGIAVQLPTQTPLASVLDLPTPGWTFTSKTAKLATPIDTDDGPVSQVVSQVTWRASAGNGIKPGQFGQFALSVGPLPKVDSITFKVVQSYSDGTTVSWIEVPAPGSTVEPEHPAPVLRLAPADAASGSVTVSQAPAAAPKKQSQTVPVTLAVIALVVAVGAAALATVAVRRRRPGEHA